MSRDERHRAELFELLVPSVGREASVMLVEALPPAGEPLATAGHIAALDRRIDVLEQRMDDRFAAAEQRMDDRFAAAAQRMDDRFAAAAQHTDDRMVGLGDELLAAFRGELVAAVSAQTRQMIVAILATVFGIGGLAVTLAQIFSRVA